MKSCIRNQDLMARFIHGDLLRQDKEELERHLDDCQECRILYNHINDVDHAFRELPGKLVEPPAYLRGRILAHLPEESAARSRRRAIGWVAACSGAAACALLAIGVYRAAVPSHQIRVATAPSPVPSGGPATRSAQREIAPSAPAPVPAETASRDIPPPTKVAKATEVKVIQEVRIYFYYPPAEKVAVTGDFNGWDPDGVPLTRAGKPGLWETNLKLKPGAYSYNFIVDGNVLVPDPNAPSQAPDGFGGTNSILLVKAGDRA